MGPAVKFPFYARFTFILVGIYLIVYTLYIGSDIIVPIAYSTIIAILLSPLVSFLERRKLKRIPAIALAVLFAFFCLAALLYFIASQLTMFDKALPMMQAKFNSIQLQLGQWISMHFNIRTQSVNSWFARTKTELAQNGNAMIGRTIVTITGLLIVVFLLPVYVFMILYYEPLLLLFCKRLFDKTRHQKLEEVLMQTKGVVQNYLIGLLIEALIIASLNSIALLIIGIDYAILIGIIGALLNMIPFVGGIIAVAIPMAIALFTKDSGYYAILVMLAYMVIQFFDNHYITPRIVASKVRINALVAIVVVLIGNTLWGIPGMFLALPVTGILKVIFGHSDSLKPWAILLGDTMPVGVNIFNFSGRKKKNAETGRLSAGSFSETNDAHKSNS